MKQLLSFILLFCTINLFADTPGKKQMHDSKVSFQNLTTQANYQFYYKKRYDHADSVYKLIDGSVNIPSSGGAPDGIWFWGVNTSTQKNTDTVNVNNYYAPDYVFIINKIENDSIYYTQKELSNKNEIVKEGNTDEITDKTLIAEAKKAKQNHYLKIGLFSVAGLVALGGVVWFFRRRKK